MKSFKRIMLVVLAFILLFNLTSCNNNKYNAKVYSKDSKQYNKTYKTI